MRAAARPLVLALALLATACAERPGALAPPPSASPRADAPLATPSGSALASPAATVEGMRIRIPRLGIDLPLREGDASRDVPSDAGPGATPEGAAFHYPGTAVPGEPGNAYVYAHARVGMFLTLWQAALGDRVEISRADGSTLVYVVAEIHPDVRANDVSWLQPSEDERLTLQTSTGPTPSYPRFVVVARRST